MLFYQAEVRESPVAGRGLFSKEPIPKGAVVGFLARQAPLMTEDEYQDAQHRGEQVIIMSAVRLAGKYFIYGSEISDEEYINHSSDPSLLYHCGIAFAKRDIAAGDELTVDYKYFLAQNDVGRFTDSRTGRLVDGVDGRQAMIESCKELLALLADGAEFGEPRYSDYGRTQGAEGD
jgi:SET domain-containing protein